MENLKKRNKHEQNCNYSEHHENVLSDRFVPMQRAIKKSFPPEHDEGNHKMEDIRNHETDVSHDLVQVALSKEDVLNELVKAASCDMQKRDPHNAQHLAGSHEILFIG